MRSARFSEAAYMVLAMALSTLVLGLIFWSVNGTDPMWAVISFILVYDPDVRVAFASGLNRLALTILGSALALIAVFSLGLHKWLLPVSLAITAVICGLLFRSPIAWRIVLVTVALIVGSSLLQPSSSTYVAITRSIEVTFGSLLAILFSWLVAGMRSRSKEKG